MNAGTTAIVSYEAPESTSIKPGSNGSSLAPSPPPPLDPSSPSVHEYSLDRLIQNTDPRENPVLRGGETVRVMPARLVYVVGALEKPGAFPIVAAEPISALKALALAQGIKSPADKSHSFIFRSRADGTREEIPLDVDKLLKHKAPDVAMTAGDILYIPESGKRKALGTVLTDAGAVAVTAVGFGVANGKF
jgi:protein involved in polysaccharide export with SLBB domain